MDLIRALDALVLQDAQPSHLDGTVTLGIRGAHGYRYWSARFAGQAATEHSAERPTTSDATLFLDAADADAIVRTGRLPQRPRALYFDGDRKLMTRFITRYTARTSWLGVQGAGR